MTFLRYRSISTNRKTLAMKDLWEPDPSYLLKAPFLPIGDPSNSIIKSEKGSSNSFSELYFLAR